MPTTCRQQWWNAGWKKFKYAFLIEIIHFVCVSQQTTRTLHRPSSTETFNYLYRIIKIIFHSTRLLSIQSILRLVSFFPPFIPFSRSTTWTTSKPRSFIPNQKYYLLWKFPKQTYAGGHGFVCWAPRISYTRHDNISTDDDDDDDEDKYNHTNNTSQRIICNHITHIVTYISVILFRILLA